MSRKDRCRGEISVKERQVSRRDKFRLASLDQNVVVKRNKCQGGISIKKG
jgi:hypothetical protein